MTFTHTGKQVLANGHHFADASDEQAAELIVKSIKMYVLIVEHFGGEPNPRKRPTTEQAAA